MTSFTISFGFACLLFPAHYFIVISSPPSPSFPSLPPSLNPPPFPTQLTAYGRFNTDPRVRETQLSSGQPESMNKEFRCVFHHL